MRKKSELPRKRRRFIRRVIFFSSCLFTVFVIAIGIGFYFLFMKWQKPLYISPVPTTVHAAQSDQGEITIQQIESGLRKQQIAFTSVQRQNDAYLLTLPDNSKVTFSSQKDIMTQIASLQYILSHLTMEGRAFSSLDLRFDQPVIVIKQ